MDGLLVFIFGLALGSFVNVLSDRLPQDETVLWGRSHCDYCQKTLRWWELIPVFSFLLQAGRCRRCRKRLSLQYPVVELITGFGLVAVWQTYPSPLLRTVAVGIIFVSFLVMFLADFKYQILPDSMVVTALVGAVLYRWSVAAGSPVSATTVGLLAGLAAAAFFFLLWLVTAGRGMGMGDVKLAFVMGFLLGFPLIVVGLYLAFLTGAIVGVILILVGQKSMKSRVAFGPFLLVAILVSLYWRESILIWWRSIW